MSKERANLKNTHETAPFHIRSPRPYQCPKFETNGLSTPNTLLIETNGLSRPETPEIETKRLEETKNLPNLRTTQVPHEAASSYPSHASTTHCRESGKAARLCTLDRKKGRCRQEQGMPPGDQYELLPGMGLPR